MGKLKRRRSKKLKKLENSKNNGDIKKLKTNGDFELGGNAKVKFEQNVNNPKTGEELGSDKTSLPPILLDGKFSETGLSTAVVESISKMGFETMTPVQAKTIPHILVGKDIIAAAKTGSGKTLAFLAPIIEKVISLKQKAFKFELKGTRALVISPTRELSIQIFNVGKQLCDGKDMTIGLVIGGSNRSQEAKRFRAENGINLLIATPGRLLDHLKNTKGFSPTAIEFLAIDEADRILDSGFEAEMKSILKLLPKKRQTVLFSATLTERTKNFMKISFPSKPLYVGVDEFDEQSTREGLRQGFVRVEADKKFILLYSFLKKQKKKKILVFFSTCDETKFFHELLKFVDIPVQQLHGKLKQGKRTSAFNLFNEAENGVLLATDVAARGLDFPKVDWIVQFNPPDCPKSYIHRVGRTARGINSKGSALIFLLPSEEKYVEELKHLKVTVKEFKFPCEKICNVQSQIEEIVSGNSNLEKLGRNAFRAYLKAYDSFKNKDVFDIYSLDVSLVAKAFGFDAPPKISLDISLGGKRSRKRVGRKLSQNRVPDARSVKQFCRN